MRIPSAVAALAFAVPLCAYAANDGTFNRTLQVKGPVLIGLDDPSGDVRITAGPVSTVQIVGHVHGDHGMFSEDASAAVARILAAPPISQAGNIISIGHNFQEHHVTIDYQITTPRGTDLRVNTGSGDVHVAGTGGPIDLTTGSGTIEASGVADHVSLETGSGDIHAQLDAARDVKAQTGSGSIDIRNVQGGLWAHTGSGSIQISGRPLAAAWRVETGSGDITLDTGGAPLDLNANTGSGGVTYSGSGFQPSGGNSSDHLVGHVGGGGPTVRATSGSGSIHVR